MIIIVYQGGPYPSNYGAGFGAVENSYVSNGGLIGNAGNMYGNNAGFISTGYGVLSPNRGHAPQQFTYPQGKHGPINEGFGMLLYLLYVRVLLTTATLIMIHYCTSRNFQCVHVQISLILCF